jgi:hypothetical protein
MATELREQQTSQVVRERQIASNARLPFWPLLVAGLALATLVVAGVVFFAGDETPLRIDPSVIEKMNTNAREGGEYVTAPNAGSVSEPTTSNREGGEYLPPGAMLPAEPTTLHREGGEYADTATSNVDPTTASREGGEYATP